MIFILFCLQVSLVSALSALCDEFYQAEPGQADLQIQGEFKFICSSANYSVDLNTKVTSAWRCV